MVQPADLFAEIWATLDRRLDELRALDAHEEARVELGNLVAEAEGMLLLPDGVDELRRWTERHDLVGLVAAAMAIDKWYEPLTFQGQDEGPAAVLDDARSRAKFDYRRRHRLNEDGEAGQVILRLPLWGRWSDPLMPRPDDSFALSQLFDTLVLLPAEIDGTDPDEKGLRRPIRFRYVHRASYDARPLPGEVLRVGFAPIAEAKSDLPIRLTSLGGRPAYDVRAVPQQKRVARVIERLCAEGCHIIALPEMVMHQETLAMLKEKVRELGPGSELALVLAGTRRAERSGGLPPYNEAVVLDQTGEEILRQRKLSRWNLNRKQCERYGLRLPDKATELCEFISPGEEMIVVEQPHLGRLAVLVCEDLSRSQPGRWIRANLLLDLQLTPVLDGPLRSGLWSVLHGGPAAHAGRCRVLVANSLPLTLRQNETNTRNNPAWVVERCGVGLGIDVASDEPRYAIATMALNGAADRTVSLDWKPEEWDPVPTEQRAPLD